MKQESDDSTMASILDYLLDRARSGEKQARLQERLRRGTRGHKHAAQQSPDGIVRETTSWITDSVHASVGQTRDRIRAYAAAIIKRQAPELNDRQIQQLLDAWVPGDSPLGEGPSGDSPTGKRSQRGPSRQRQLPTDAQLTMIHQFVSYSTGKMPVREQAELSANISDWKQRYWQSFSEPVQRLIAAHLKGHLDSTTFWKAVAMHMSKMSP